MTPELYHILLKNVILFSRPVQATLRYMRLARVRADMGLKVKGYNTLISSSLLICLNIEEGITQNNASLSC